MRNIFTIMNRGYLPSIVEFIFYKKRSGKFAFAFIFLLALASRGQSTLGYFSIDDAALFSSLASDSSTHQLSSGRFTSAALFFLVDNFGVSLVSVSWATWLTVLALFSVTILQTLKLLSVQLTLVNLMIVSISVAHPYHAEIFTFQIAAIPSLVVHALIVCLLSLQLSNVRSALKTFWSSLILFLVLSQYQIHLNSMAIVLLFLLVFASLNSGDSGRLRSTFKSLTVAVIVSSLLTLIVGALLRSAIGVQQTSRGEFISLTDWPSRFLQILNQNQTILFGTSEPVFGGSPKLIYGFVTVLFTIIVIIRIIRRIRFRFSQESFWNLASVGSLIGVFVFFPGLISVLEDWWPVPRVLSHVGLFTSLVTLAAFEGARRSPPFLRILVSVFVAISAVGGVMASNQIFSDQATINRLDRNLAERIVLRLEETQGYESSTSLAVVGRFYSYPIGVRTMQGDLNISAFMTTPYRLFEFTTGRPFVQASGEDLELAVSACDGVGVFPSKSSVFVLDSVAVVCLSK